MGSKLTIDILLVVMNQSGSDKFVIMERQVMTLYSPHGVPVSYVEDAENLFRSDNGSVGYDSCWIEEKKHDKLPVSYHFIYKMVQKFIKPNTRHL